MGHDTSRTQRLSLVDKLVGSARWSRRILVAGTALILVLAWSVWFVFTQHEREEAIEAATRRQSNLILVVSHYLARSLSNSTALAQYLARARDTEADFTATLVERAAANELFSELLYCGADRYAASSRPADADSTSHCAAWLASAPPGARAHAAAPIATRNGTHVPLLTYVPAGAARSEGVLVLLIELPRLLGLLQGYKVPDETTVLVLAPDGGLRARWHSSKFTSDQRAPEAALLPTVLSRGQPGQFHAIEGRPKIMTARRAEPSTLYVLIATDLGATLDTPRRRSLYMALGNGVATLLLPLFAFIVLRLQARIVDVGTALGDAQKQLEQMNERLEGEVAARTAQLERAYGDLETFTYSVAHDVRAPIGAIKGFADVLKATVAASGNEKSIHYLQRIIANASQMDDLTESLLALGKISRAPLSLAAVDLQAIASDVLYALRERDPGARIVLTTIEGDLRVMADRVLMRQVMENLLGNAWKFTSRRETAEISVTGQSNEDSGETTICVRDNGEGFDASSVAKLFKPFQRMHSASEFPGTGVGLATVERIVAKHGGRVWLESSPQAGTSVFFTLPRAAD
ncbi:sensor histidine kinase [Ramlibacter sp.]|uniref:sensor histidine kinase n=1 Tax=Ramlibacter sp. TaxID=1917967 RepID=UPI003D11A609